MKAQESLQQLKIIFQINNQQIKRRKKNMTEKTIKKEIAEKIRMDENTIFVGNKPPMSYVLAVVTQFNSIGSDRVSIKARGSAISRAVDTAEIVKNRFMKNVTVKNIITSTESMTNEEGRNSNVSSIEINLINNKKAM
jgi:DNA-binding protein